MKTFVRTAVCVASFIWLAGCNTSPGHFDGELNERETEYLRSVHFKAWYSTATTDSSRWKYGWSRDMGSAREAHDEAKTRCESVVAPYSIPEQCKLRYLGNRFIEQDDPDVEALIKSYQETPSNFN